MTPSTPDANFLMRLQQMLQDPTTRAQLQNIINNAPGGSSSLSGTLARTGQAMAANTTPGIGSTLGGLGTVLGTGIGTLLRKRNASGVTSPVTTQGPVTNTAISSAPVMDNPGVTPSVGVAPSTNPIANIGAGATEVPVPPPPYLQQRALNTSQPTSSPLQPGAPLPPIPAAAAGSGFRGSLLMGSDARGTAVHSYDGGTTWITDSGQIASGPIYNQTNIGGAMRRGGRVRAFAKGGGEDLPPAPLPKGRAVLTRRPIPVIATTIVIAKKKPEKKAPERKARGGPVGARKPHALPPVAGPGNGKRQGNQHQRQVTPVRGWGIETRGRKATRIY